MLRIPQKKNVVKITVNSDHLFTSLNNYLKHLVEATGLNMNVPIIFSEASCFLNTCLISLAVPAITFVDILTF